MIKFSPPKSKPEYVGRMTRMGMTTLMILTHGAAALLTLILAQQVRDVSGLGVAALLGASFIIGGLYGWLITSGVLGDLERIETALHRLAQGLPTGDLPTKGREPMRFIMEHVNALIARQRELNAMRQQLSEQIGEAAAQEERGRLARDLHDSIKQQIFSISVSAAAAQVRWENDPAGARAALDDIRRSAQEAMVEMRALLQQLAPAPLEKVGLTQALRDQCEALGYRSGAQVTCTIEALPADDQLPVGTQEVIFRIAQEALTNIARHARAQTAALTVCTDPDTLHMRIEDDGQGFDPAVPASGMGLANMKARANAVGGTFEITSRLGGGTELHLTIPLQPQPLIETEGSEEMSTEMKTKIDEIKVWVQGAAAGMFISAVLLFVAVLGLGRDELPPVLVVFTVVFGLLGVGGMVGGMWAFARGWRKLRDLTPAIEPMSTAWALLRYHIWGGLLVVPLFAFVFVPTLVIPAFGSSAALISGALALVGLIGVLMRSFTWYDRYMRALSPSQLARAVHENFVESGWNRWSFLWALPMLLNLAFDFPPQFPLTSSGDWLDLALPGAGVLFIIWALAYLLYHRSIRQRVDLAEVMS